jgi:ribonuclease P protein component
MNPSDRDYRLRSPRRISELFEIGLRAQDAAAMMVGAPAAAGDLPRMAFAVGRRHGGAVQRNRIRRLCREAFRQVRAELPGGWDFVLVPHSRPEHSVLGLAATITHLTRRIVQLQPTAKIPAQETDAAQG